MLQGTLLKDSLQATDIDEGDNAKVTYSIVNTTAGSDVKNTTRVDLFRIVTKDAMYAQIYANIDLDGFFGTYTICLMVRYLIVLFTNYNKTLREQYKQNFCTVILDVHYICYRFVISKS